MSLISLPTDQREQAIAAASRAMAECGYDFPLPVDGDLDDEERGRYDALCAAIDAALAAIPAQAVPDGWEDIASAPKDGSEFLALNVRAGAYRVVYFDDEAKDPYCWHVDDAAKGFNHHRDFFTHWKPLDPLPIIAEEREQS